MPNVGALISIALDALEDTTRFSHVGTVIIVGGDSDFMPVAQKMKAAGRTLIGIGTRRNTNRHWSKSCHEFRYYENLIEAPAEEPRASGAEDAVAPPEQPSDSAAELLRRAVRLLSEGAGEPWVNKASIGPMIKRLDPTFNLKEFGYGSFSEMIKALNQVVEVRKGESDHEVRLRQ